MRKIFLFLSLILVTLAPKANANGSVSFTEEVLPLLAEHPEITDPLLDDLDIDEIGRAVRIGPHACPVLAGVRVSPYIFLAQKREPSFGRYRVTILTNVDFFDRLGNIVYRIRDGVPDEDDSAFYQAERYEETFSSLFVRRENEE